MTILFTACRRAFYLSILGATVSFVPSIHAATLETDRKVYVSGEMVQIIYSGLPGNDSDWITIVPRNSSNTSYDEWNYTQGNLSGSMDFFRTLGPGLYQARAYFDWSGRNNDEEGYTIKASTTFRVVEDSFRSWLWQQDTQTLHSYSKTLEKQVNGWLKKGESELSNANLNIQALRAAFKEIHLAQLTKDKGIAANHIDGALDKIGALADIVALKGLLQFVTSPPKNTKATTIVLEAIKAELRSNSYFEKKDEIEKAIAEGTPDAYKRVQKELQEAENKAFGAK